MSQAKNRGITRRRQWIKDWSEGLAHCLECDHEYADYQILVINDEKSCPNCKKPENKKYYYCPDTGEKGCECKWH